MLRERLMRGCRRFRRRRAAARDRRSVRGRVVHVASRRAEIGVRVALGASRRRILSMILGDIGRVLAVGVAVGIGLALLSARAISSLLFGVAADDLTTLLIAAGVMAGLGMIAALWPAKRATGIDPVTALRES